MAKIDPATLRRMEVRKNAERFIGPTPERLAKGDLRGIEVWARSDKRYASKWPTELERLGAVCNSRTGKPYLERRQVQAGLWLRETWNRAGLEPRVVASYGQTVAGHESGLDGVVTARDKARREFAIAMRRIGIAFSALVVRVCIEDERPNAEALTQLRPILDDLAGWRGL